MEAKIVAIGNSQGVRLPKAVLRRARLNVGQTVNIDVAADSRIVITREKHPRAGWEEAFKKAGAKCVKENLWGDIPLDEAWDK
jgi:antitoxin MazE